MWVCIKIISCLHITALYPGLVLFEIDRKSPTLFFSFAIDQSMGTALGKIFLPQVVTYTSQRHNTPKTASNILVCVGSSHLWSTSSPVVYFILWSSNKNKCCFFVLLFDVVQEKHCMRSAEKLLIFN